MNKRNDVSADIWEQADWMWTLIFVVSVLIPVPILWLTADNADLPWAQIILLCSGLIVWHWLAVHRPLPAWPIRARQNLPESLLYIVVVMVGWYWLARISPVFNFALGGVYSQLFSNLPIRWSFALSYGFALLIAHANALPDEATLRFDNPFMLIVLGTNTIGAILGLYIYNIIAQSRERRQLIEQLEQTRSELAQSEREAGVLQERQRLAREIHDTLAQGFSSIVMHLEAVEQALSVENPIVQHHLSLARQTARDSLGQARRVVDDLRPQILEGNSLDEALRRTTEKWQTGNQIPIEYVVTGTMEAQHPEIEVTLLRATQEALANIRKHANATQVNVTLSYMEDLIVLDVHDNGIGFAAHNGVSKGFGLTAMRQRVDQQGGSLLVESVPNEGTTLVVELPIRNGEYHDQNSNR